LVFSQGVVGPGKAFFAEICRQGLEGMMAKRLVSRYRPGRRSDAWIKIKPKEGKRPIS
jgi:ATP-dependent DNA ligase